MLNITPPAALQGDERAQLTQVYRYLFRLSEQLNMALVETETRMENIQTGKTASAPAAGVASDDKLAASLAGQYNTLKSLITKTAEAVYAEMDAIVTKLESEYVAVSEWGSYKEEISTEIKQTAKATVESYGYDAQISDVKEDVAGFEAYKIETEGFIKRGIIGYDDENFPIIGIAIGQELKSSTVTIDGVTYEEFDTTVNMATYTADKLSFWVNGVEVAYLSNSELVVTRIIVSDSIRLGDWDIEVNAADGMTIQKRIGDALDLSGNSTITITADQINAVADDIDLSGNRSITLTADHIEQIADQIDLSANNSIILAVGEAKDKASEAQSEASAARSTANAARTAASTAQSTANAARTAAGSAQGAANAAQETADAAQGAAGVAQETANAAEDKADAAVKSIGEIPIYVEIKEEGVYIKDRQGVSTLKLDSGSVNIGAVESTEGSYSRFTSDYVQFGNYQLRKTADGGMAFKVKEGE